MQLYCILHASAQGCPCLWADDADLSPVAITPPVTLCVHALLQWPGSVLL